MEYNRENIYAEQLEEAFKDMEVAEDRREAYVKGLTCLEAGMPLTREQSEAILYNCKLQDRGELGVHKTANGATAHYYRTRTYYYSYEDAIKYEYLFDSKGLSDELREKIFAELNAVIANNQEAIDMEDNVSGQE